MARRNIFQPPPPPPEDPADRPRFPNTGAMSGVKSTLRDLSSNAVREIDPAAILDDGPRDRLDFDDAAVAALAESIRAHGQQVPLMVRPLPDRPGQYRIVYGRRRLRALRLLGLPARALVRSLSDEQALMAQGQENAQRLDPSFIEKALFAAQLAAAGYEGQVILDALAVDRPMLSRMAKVAREVPEAVIRLVGPAHGTGRRKWEDLADLARDGRDLAAVAAGLAFDGLGSDARFAALLAAAQERPPAPPALPILHPDGTRLAEMKAGARALTLRFARTDAPGFADWLESRAEAELAALYDRWLAAGGPDAT